MQDDWDSEWQDSRFSPFWWIDGPHIPIRRAVDDGWLQRGCSLLELGCGAGQQAEWLQRQGFRVLATDVSTHAIERARRDFGYLADLSFDVMDAVAPNKLHRTFDAIVDAGCLHSISPGKHPDYVRNVTAWSRAGTRFILMVQCRDYRPADRERQITRLFSRSFEFAGCNLSMGVLPRAPNLSVMTFRLVRMGS